MSDNHADQLEYDLDIKMDQIDYLLSEIKILLNKLTESSISSKDYMANIKKNLSDICNR